METLLSGRDSTRGNSFISHPLLLSNNYIGLDEAEEEKKKEDYRSFRSLERTEDYLGRKKLFMQTAI
jgi:hypothetical protein